MDYTHIKQFTNVIMQVMTIATMGMVLTRPVIMLQRGLSGASTQTREGDLIDQYGKWQVQRAKAVCPKGDWVCIQREASRLSAVLRERYAQTESSVLFTLVRFPHQEELQMLEANVPGAAGVLEQLRRYEYLSFENLRSVTGDVESTVLAYILIELEAAGLIVGSTSTS